MRLLLFLSLVFCALALVPAGAHLAELANKISLPAAQYLTVQQIYAGWALFGIVVIGALASTAALAGALWRQGEPYGLALGAFLCIGGTQLVFWWEYSHAASAVLNLAALLFLAALAARRS